MNEERMSCENCSNKWVRGLCKHTLLRIIYRDRAVPNLCERGLRQLAGSCRYYAEPKPEPTGFEKWWNGPSGSSSLVYEHKTEEYVRAAWNAGAKEGKADGRNEVIAEVRDRWETTKDIDDFCLLWELL